MNRSLLTLLVSWVVCVLPADRVWAESKPNPVGNWKWVVKQNDGKTQVTLRIKRLNENQMTGTIQIGVGKEKQIDDLALQDRELSFVVKRGPEGKEVTSKYRGEIDGNSIKGNVEVIRNGKSETSSWIARSEGVRIVTKKPEPPAPVKEGMSQVKCTPDSVSFGRLEPGREATRIVKMTCLEDKISIDDLKFTSESKSIQIKQTSTDSHSATFEITYTASAGDDEQLERGQIKVLRGEEELGKCTFIAIRIAKK